MKSLSLNSICAAGVLVILAMPLRLAAQSQLGAPEQGSTTARYTIIDLGTLQGGTFSQPFSITRNGIVAGSSTNSGGSQNAVLWFQGKMYDIGSPGLGGANSIAFGLNDSGQAAGEAENSVSDPNGEDFCGFGTHVTCLPFVWAHDVTTPLPTLGGNNGEATFINDLGQVSGYAETSIPDTHCPLPQVLHFKPVYWENGRVHRLPTFRGDPDGIAISINDRGQAVGASGTCTTFNPIELYNLLPVHALLWENGKATDLGNLGGKTGKAGGNIANNINNQGQVIGVSDLSGDTTYHAFIWTKASGMKDLGTLSGDVDSSAVGINDRGVVVGGSIDASGNPRAFIWQNGAMADLNALATNSPLYLLFGCAINSDGVITGLGFTSAGELHTYLATPTSRADSESHPATENAPKALSEEVRALIRQRMRFGRLGAPVMGKD